MKQFQKAIGDYKDTKLKIEQSFTSCNLPFLLNNQQKKTHNLRILFQVPVIQKNPFARLLLVVQEAQDLMADFKNDEKILRSNNELYFF